MRRVVIVGGGFSGAAAAIHLGRRSVEPLEILVVEPREAPGKGLAHSSSEPDHRLNGPDGIHSPYPEEPAHFAQWLRDSGTLAADPRAAAATGLVFARRGDFGRYMAAELDRHARTNPSGSRIEHVRQAAHRLVPAAAGTDVELADGARVRADACILALGWNRVAVPRELAVIERDRRWLGDPWDTARLDAVPAAAPVLLVGSGLTASDVFAALRARGHHGPVLSLSRHGLRPGSQNPHRSTRSIWERVLETDPAILRRTGHPATVREAVRTLRREMAAVDSGTSSWHTPFDELRDAAWLFWGEWAEAEQRRFVRHAKAWYDAFRYRNPPQVERIVDDGLASGQLAFAAGRVRTARALPGGIQVEHAARGTGERGRVRVGAVINCTGPQPRPSASGNPLWVAMIHDGLARDAPGGLGVDVDQACRVLDGSGRPHQALFAVGPPTMGRFGEAAAVPYVVRGILDVTRRFFGSTAAGSGTAAIDSGGDHRRPG